MPGRSVPVLGITLTVAGLLGCASAPSAPDGWLPTPAEVSRDPRGAWIQVELQHQKGAPKSIVEGELIAIGPSTLYVAEPGVLRAVAIDSVAQARLSYFATNPSVAAGATVGGILLTMSNGWFLVFTAPGWLAVGTGATASRSRDGMLRSRDADWDEFRKYARFPTDMPPSFGTGPVPEPQVPKPQVSPPKLVVAEPPAPRAPPWTARPRDKTAYWFDIGAGPGFNTSHTGLAFLGAANVARKAFMVGARFMAVDRGRPNAGEPAYFDTGGGVYDVALLLGLRGDVGSMHTSVSAGPAAYAFSVDDLVDLNWSVGGQAELYVFPNEYLGVGTTVGYNWNDIRNFFVISFGLAIGIP
jgi:hypothetical protein